MLLYGISTLLIQLAFASCIQALAVLLPLYVYPGDSCSAWSPVFAAITAHLLTTFYIILNPNSGPGSGGSQPDNNFVNCVPQLRPSGSNTILLGYVDTISPTSGSVDSDIDTYAGWDSAYRPTGIFLDDVTPSEESVSTYQGYVSHATSMGFTFTALDPGKAASSSYYDMVDLVNTYEDEYSTFDPSSALSGTLTKQSVILLNSPSTGTYTSVISQLASLGVEAVYISDVSVTSSDLPIQLSEFVSEVASTEGVQLDSSRFFVFRIVCSTSGSASSGSTSSGTTSGSNSSGSNPSDPSDPNSSGSGSPVSPSNAASSPFSSRSPSSTPKGSAQSTALKGGLATSSALSTNPSSSSSSPLSPGSLNQATSVTHNGPPIAAIVGGVLGGLIFLLASLIIFMCIRRRRHGVAAAYPEAPAPFTAQYDANAAVPLTIPPSTTSISDTKAPASEARLSSEAPTDAEADAAAPADENDTRVPSTRVSYPSTLATLSAAPAYWESRRASAAPPPSYSADD
ncbi:Spherulation-specific family 4-domain-containing protein [Mycena galericulata]|nr:Spherulation-specific family 4-domain-containing protein [Mycena galericulata]